MRDHRVVVVLLTVLWGTPAISEPPIYRWIDDNGVTHFANAPPPSIEVIVSDLDRPNIVAARPKISERAELPKKAKTHRRVRASKSRPAPFQLQAKRAEKCHVAEQGLRAKRQQRRAGYTASQGRKLKHDLDRYRADIRFYCD